MRHTWALPMADLCDWPHPLGKFETGSAYMGGLTGKSCPREVGEIIETGKAQ